MSPTARNCDGINHHGPGAVSHTFARGVPGLTAHSSQYLLQRRSPGHPNLTEVLDVILDLHHRVLVGDQDETDEGSVEMLEEL